MKYFTTSRERERERERERVILDPYRTSGQCGRNLSFTCTTENKVIRSGLTISSKMKDRTEPWEHWRRNAAARSAKTIVPVDSEQPLCDSWFTRTLVIRTFKTTLHNLLRSYYNFANIFSFFFNVTFLDYLKRKKCTRTVKKKKKKKKQRTEENIRLSFGIYTRHVLHIKWKNAEGETFREVYPYEFKNYSTVCRTIVLQHLHKDHVQKRTGNCPGSTAYRNKIEENFENFEIYSFCVKWSMNDFILTHRYHFYIIIINKKQSYSS